MHGSTSNLARLRGARRQRPTDGLASFSWPGRRGVEQEPGGRDFMGKFHCLIQMQSRE